MRFDHARTSYRLRKPVSRRHRTGQTNGLWRVPILDILVKGRAGARQVRRRGLRALPPYREGRQGSGHGTHRDAAPFHVADSRRSPRGDDRRSISLIGSSCMPRRWPSGWVMTFACGLPSTSRINSYSGTSSFPGIVSATRHQVGPRVLQSTTRSPKWANSFAICSRHTPRPAARSRAAAPTQWLARIPWFGDCRAGFGTASSTGTRLRSKAMKTLANKSGGTAWERGRYHLVGAGGGRRSLAHRQLRKIGSPRNLSRMQVSPGLNPRFLSHFAGMDSDPIDHVHQQLVAPWHGRGIASIFSVRRSASVSRISSDWTTIGGLTDVLRIPDMIIAGSNGRFERAPVDPSFLHDTLREHARMFPGKPLMIVENGSVPIASGVHRARYIRDHMTGGSEGGRSRRRCHGLHLLEHHV